MDKTQKLRDRGFFINILNAVTKSISDSFTSLLSNLDKKVFRVRIENEKYFVKALEKTAETMDKAGASIRELKLAENLDHVKTDLIHTISSNTVQGFSVQNIDTLNIEKLAQTEVVNKLEDLNKKLNTLNELATIMKSVADKEIKMPVMPKSMGIEGEVGVDSLPEKLYTLLGDIKTDFKSTIEAIKAIKIDAPKPADIKFPEKMDIANLSKLETSLKELKKAIEALPESMPKVEFPNEIKTHVISEPPRLTPQPVTNFNLNPLRGVIEDTKMMVDFPVALPPVPLENRRSIIIFNNSTTDTLYIGNNATAPGTGFPIPPQSYSPVIDAGVKMTIYGCTTGAQVDTRILEVSNDAIGG